MKNASSITKKLGPFRSVYQKGKKVILGVDKDRSSMFKESDEGEVIVLHGFKEFLDTHRIRNIDLIKINIEGAEYEFITDKLQNYGYFKDAAPFGLKRRIEYALNWARDFEETIGTQVDLSPNERRAVKQLVQTMQTERDAEAFQSAIFEIARNNGVKPKSLFKTLYNILLGTSSGPRLGPYLIDMGRENAIRILKKNLMTSKD